MDDITLADNPAARRYELRKSGVVAAHAEYTPGDGVITVTHTEVQAQYGGQGLGSKLAKFVLDDVRKRGLKAVAECDFIAAYIQRHESYRDLVAGPASPTSTC